MNWDNEINHKHNLLSVNLGEIIKYKDLIYMLVKKDFVSLYKQTILGPLWFFIQPVITTIAFTIVFGNLANISTDGVPGILFYMSGVILWSHFSLSLVKSSSVFIDNQHIFGKVYFPRLTVPISIAISSIFKFLVQFFLFICVYCYYLFSSDNFTGGNEFVILLPIVIIVATGLSLGFGLLISSLTTKYRDFVFLINFGIQILMYATPVVYPLSLVPENMKIYMMLNPMTGVIESFRYMFFSTDAYNWFIFLYSSVFMLFLVFLGVIIFRKTERNVMDTI